MRDRELPGATWVAIGPGDTEEIGAIGYDVDAVVRIASLTKPFTAMLTLRLADRGLLSLHDPIERWLPELARRPVLRDPSAELDDTVPPRRRLTVHDLLVMGLGFGWHPAFDGGQPMTRAMEGIGPGPFPPAMSPEAWLTEVGALPMIHQPGEGWLYDSSYLALGILLERAADDDLNALLGEHVTGPLGMTDTGYTVPERDLDRLPAYLEPSGSTLMTISPAGDVTAARSPELRGGTTGLYSTARDLSRLARFLLADDELAPLMAQDHRSDGQRAMSELFLEPGVGWGYGVGVDLAPRYGSADRFGWSGGTGTTLFVDPRRGTACALLTQVGLGAEFMTALLKEFWQVTA